MQQDVQSFRSPWNRGDVAIACPIRATKAGGYLGRSIRREWKRGSFSQAVAVIATKARLELQQAVGNRSRGSKILGAANSGTHDRRGATHQGCQELSPRFVSFHCRTPLEHPYRSLRKYHCASSFGLDFFHPVRGVGRERLFEAPGRRVRRRGGTPFLYTPI